MSETSPDMTERDESIAIRDGNFQAN